MTAILPPHLLKNFAPRPPLPFFPPQDTAVHQPVHVTGVGAYLSRCKDHDKEAQETILQRRARLVLEKQKTAQETVSKQLQTWDPQTTVDATPDPYTTLFVGRLSHATTDIGLQKEFSKFGAVEKVVVVKDKQLKSRGYAFVQFGNEADLKEAFKRSDGVKIEGNRVVVDVERGRTVKGWRPKRLGGGLGGTRDGGPEMNQLYSGRDTGKRGRSRDQRREEPVVRRDVGRREEHPPRRMDMSRMEQSRRYEPSRDDQRDGQRNYEQPQKRDERQRSPQRRQASPPPQRRHASPSQRRRTRSPPRRNDNGRVDDRRQDPRRDDRRVDDRRRDEPRREERREPRRDEARRGSHDRR